MNTSITEFPRQTSPSRRICRLCGLLLALHVGVPHLAGADDARTVPQRGESTGEERVTDPYPSQAGHSELPRQPRTSRALPAETTHPGIPPRAAPQSSDCL